VFVAVTWVNFNQEAWKGRAVLTYDVAQYYSYLPAVFYEHDLSQRFLNDTVHAEADRKHYASTRAPNGNHVFKMTMGMSLSYLPFFAVAHAYTTLTHSGREGGFAPAYHFAIQFSSLFWFLIGLFFLIKVLRRFFPDGVVSLTLFCICFGTNVFYYLTIGAGMSHAVNFMLMAAFLHYALTWHEQPGYKSAVMVGIFGALLTLIRPVNILVYLFFFLYKVCSLTDLRSKINFFRTNRLHVLIMALLGLLIFMPQLCYWKFISGHYFFNSYNEYFYFAHPHVLDGLFSFRKGWLIYTPMMCFALAGILLLRNNLGGFSFALPVFLIVYLYVIFSWWCWWYGGSFGQRPLIDAYPLLAIPFAALLYRASQAVKIRRTVLYVALSCLVLLNLFQTVQAKYNIIHFDSMTRENYFRVFFTTSKQPDRDKYLKPPDYGRAMRGEKEY